MLDTETERRQQEATGRQEAEQTAANTAGTLSKWKKGSYTGIIILVVYLGLQIYDVIKGNETVDPDELARHRRQENRADAPGGDGP